MRGALASVALCALAACGGVKPAPQPPALKALAAFEDAGYDGGLDARGTALAMDLAAELGARLGPRMSDCDGPDAMQGVMVGRVSGAPKTDLLDALDPYQRELARLMLEGRLEQRAVAFDAMRRIGRRAAALAAAVDAAKHQGWDPWMAEALYAATCQEYQSDPLAAVPVERRPPVGASQYCDAGRVSWMLDRATDTQRRWPASFVEGANHAFTQNCDGGEQLGLELRDDQVEALVARLLDPATDRRLVTALLDVLESQGRASAPVAARLLPLTTSSDVELAARTDAVIAESEIPEAVGAVRRMIVERQQFNWSWSDLAPKLRKYAKELVPVFASALQSDTWSDRAAAAVALGELGHADAVPFLVAAISNVDWPTTEAAVQGLAPHAADARAAAALRKVAADYWSPRIRDAARKALAPRQTPKPMVEPMGASSDDDETQLDRIECFGDCAVMHGLKVCGKEGGRYLTATGEALAIEWRVPTRDALPQEKIAAITDWCASVGTAEALPIEGGRLLGCIGFEAEGRLAFEHAAAPDAPLEVIHGMGVRLLFDHQGKHYAAGIDIFGLGRAGALMQVERLASGAFRITPIAALPSPPRAMAILGDRIAFRDHENAVLFDPRLGISALNCAAR